MVIMILSVSSLWNLNSDMHHLPLSWKILRDIFSEGTNLSHPLAKFHLGLQENAEYGNQDPHQLQREVGNEEAEEGESYNNTTNP